jgi:hypothetical protein
MKVTKRELSEIFNDIKTTLQSDNHEDVYERLMESASGAATGGEGLAILASRLLYMQQENKHIREQIGHLIDELIEYCKSYGMHPRVNKF